MTHLAPTAAVTPDDMAAPVLRPPRRLVDRARAEVPTTWVVAGLSSLLALLLTAPTVDWLLPTSIAVGPLPLLALVPSFAPLAAVLWGRVAVVLAAVPLVLLLAAIWTPGTWVGLVGVAMVLRMRRSRVVAVPALLAGLLPVTLVAGLTVLWVDPEHVVDLWRDPLSMRLLVGLGWLVGLALVLLAASALRDRSELAAREASLARAAAAVEEEGGALAERARLARDLHDVVAHHVSLIAVRAETAPYTLGEELTPGARAALVAVADDARRALDELRAVLGILGRSSNDPELAPQPTLADLPGLVERSRSAGQEITLVDDGVTVEATDAVPDAVGYAAYRVVQECLTNARRHAPGAPVDVTLEVADGWLDVEVVNALAAGTSPCAAGRGTAGMRERVDALGGRLQTTTADGAYRVHAALPVRGAEA